MTDLEKLDTLISGKPEAPERIYGWLDSQLSIAQFYGGCTFKGHSYYVAPNEPGEPLVRADVLAREAKYKSVKRKADKQAAKLAQGVLL